MASIASKQKEFIRSGKLAKLSKSRSEFGALSGTDKIVADLVAKYYYAPDGSSLAQKELIRIGAIASGNLAFQGLLPDIKQTEFGYEIVFHLNRDSPYWKDIENGVPPWRHVPYQDLVIWISQKPSIQSKLSALQTKWKFKTKEKTATSLAKMIANSIYSKGIKPKGNFFSKQHDSFIAELKSKLPPEFAKDLRLEIIGNITKS